MSTHGRFPLLNRIQLNFARGLRSYLRHDPDVIMIGEIRDPDLCPGCRQRYAPLPNEQQELSLDDVHSVYRAGEHGCLQCADLGYRGRLGIFELMAVNEDLRQEILIRSDASSIKHIAEHRGMRTLREDGAVKVQRGLTSIAEVMRATQRDAALE